MSDTTAIAAAAVVALLLYLREPSQAATEGQIVAGQIRQDSQAGRGVARQSPYGANDASALNASTAPFAISFDGNYTGGDGGNGPAHTTSTPAGDLNRIANDGVPLQGNASGQGSGEPGVTGGLQPDDSWMFEGTNWTCRSTGSGTVVVRPNGADGGAPDYSAFEVSVFGIPAPLDNNADGITGSGPAAWSCTNGKINPITGTLGVATVTPSGKTYS